eukprot:SAG11_NODE_18431_length_491_cov_1.193878_1_plen_125_part_01
MSTVIQSRRPAAAMSTAMLMFDACSTSAADRSPSYGSYEARFSNLRLKQNQAAQNADLAEADPLGALFNEACIAGPASNVEPEFPCPLAPDSIPEIYDFDQRGRGEPVRLAFALRLIPYQVSRTR